MSRFLSGILLLGVPTLTLMLASPVPYGVFMILVTNPTKLFSGDPTIEFMSMPFFLGIISAPGYIASWWYTSNDVKHTLAYKVYIFCITSLVINICASISGAVVGVMFFPLTILSAICLMCNIVLVIRLRRLMM